MTTTVPSLPHDYYVANFHTLAGFVAATYHDLLTPAELAWYESIAASSINAQRLYIRLLTRRGSTFRLSRLAYPEIRDLVAAAEELSRAGLSLAHPLENLNVLLACYTKPEIVQLLDLQTSKMLPRAELVELILSADKPDCIRYIKRLQSQDSWVTPLGHPHWMLFQLCFFGNLYQDSSEFVVAQLGTHQYENYPLDKQARAFTSRAQIEAHWRYYECDVLYESLDKHDSNTLLEFSASLPLAHRDDLDLQRRVDRLRIKIARQLERLSCFEPAVELYRQSINPPARERIARIFMQDKQWDKALSVAQAMSNEPKSEHERQSALRLLAKCQQALGQPYKRQTVYKPQTQKLVLRDDGLRVEEQARRFYARQGECFHSENTLVAGVFGLFIWDILFHPISGVFFNPYQAAPVDYKQPEFHTRRADLFEERFLLLDDKTRFGAHIHEAFVQHHGKLNPLVHWRGLSEPLLSMAIDRIPLKHWRALFDRLLLDVSEHSTGLPDLVWFPAKGGYEFIEIKGPGDALQAHQRRWMQYFDQHAIACRLVHIRYRAQAPIEQDSHELDS